MARNMKHVLTLFRYFTIAASLVSTGCRGQGEGVETMTLDGKVEKIEMTAEDTGRITVVYYNEKRKQEVAGTGEVTKQTEIMINGAAAKLKDIKQGEKVRGEIRVEKRDGERKQFVIRINVDRAKPAG